METEYIKSMHSNYVRILLEEKPDEKKYQYCILGRGGIKGLLPCSLRYIDNEAYLYYDITSQQNISLLFKKRRINRAWLKDFMWSLKEIQLETDRFLLSDCNILWFPEFVYQDLERHIFSFIYMPYYSGENGFRKLLDFIVENLDYEDEELVECAYKMYGKYEENGDVYLQGHIFEDVDALEEKRETSGTENEGNNPAYPIIEEKNPEMKKAENVARIMRGENPLPAVLPQDRSDREGMKNKKKYFALFDRKNKMREEREKYRQAIRLKMEENVVAEDTYYGEESPKTFFMESPANLPQTHSLYSEDEKVLAVLEEDSITIGKYREEVDLVINEPSLSRIHARISFENGNYYIEDMNSTNGTLKNGLRLKPYEKKILKEEDEITLGKVKIVFR